MNRGVVAESLKSIIYFLNKEERRYGIGQFFLLLFASVIDVVGLASILPVLLVASEPVMIQKNRYLKFIYDTFQFSNVKAFLIFLVLGILVFFFIKNIFTVWINYKQVRFTANIAVKIVKRQYDKYLNLPYWQFNNIGSAGLMNHIYHMPTIYVSGIIRPLYLLFSDLTMTAVIVIGILIYQPILVLLLAVILAPSTILTYNALKNRTDHIGRRMNELRPVSHKLIMNSFNGFVELKLANRIAENKELFIQKQKEVQALEARSYLYNNIPVKMIEMVAILGIVTIFLYAILFPQFAGNLVTLVGLFAAAAYRLMPSVNRILTSMMMLKQNQYLIKSFNEFKEYDQEYLVYKNQKELIFDKNIQFKNVSFSFPGADKLVVKNVSFKVNKGEKVGFIGASGSGKTTLMNILLRFYIEKEGKILVDGEPLTEENLVAWYKIIGYVKQDTFLMEGSIKENITLGADQVDNERLKYALKYASLSEFVNSLPEGVNTPIGERGSKLSGGQKQRIGIARALYKKAEILVLDEATSALDTNTEREVSEAINNLSKTSITIFMIAHRITTLRECDKIYELKDSEIIAEWTYDDLIKTVI